jgi:hypothetical protein
MHMQLSKNATVVDKQAGTKIPAVPFITGGKVGNSCYMERPYGAATPFSATAMNYTEYEYILGWVDIGTSTGVQSGFVYFHEKTRKTAKKVFWSSDLLRKGYSFLCQALYNGQKIVSHNMGLMGIKRRRI